MSDVWFGVVLATIGLVGVAAGVFIGLIMALAI